MTKLHVHTQQFHAIVPTSPKSLQDDVIEKFFTHLESHGCQVKSHSLSIINGKMCVVVEAKVFEFH